jgi:hypothetical protein
MPTIDQLAPATAASDNDELLVSQSGIVRKVTRAQVLAGVQPQLAVTSGSLLGRVSGGIGGPEQIRLGANLTLSNGALSASDASFDISSLPAGTVPASVDLVPVGQGGSNTAVTYAQFMSGLAGISNIDGSQLLVTPTGKQTPAKLADFAASTLTLAGGTLTGALTLATDPAGSLQAATKKYVDGQIATTLPRTGGSLSGALTLAADPTTSLQAATKQYVDGQVDTAVPRTGGTLTGALTLAADPANSLQAATKQYVDSRVSRSGDTLTGPLVLAGDPATPSQAATKGYVDAQLSSALPKTGGTLSGALTLAADPSLSMQAATKHYVDAQGTASLPISGGTLTGPLSLPSNPASPLQAAPKQYVDSQVASAVPLAGGTLTGALMLAGDPTSSLQAATKHYVDTIGGSTTGVINIRSAPYNAKLNGVTDDTAAFKAAYQAAPAGSVIYVPNGVTVLQTPPTWGIPVTKRVKWIVDGTSLPDGTPLANAIPGGGGPASNYLPGIVVGNSATSAEVSQNGSQSTDFAVAHSSYIVNHAGGSAGGVVIANSRTDTIIYSSPSNFVWGGIDRLLWCGSQTPSGFPTAEHVGRYVQTIRQNIQLDSSGKPLPQPHLWAACLEYRDITGQPSSMAASSITVEMDWFGNGPDDGAQRQIQSLVIGQHNTSGLPVEISSIIGIYLAAGCNGHAYKVFNVNVPFSTSVLDTTYAQQMAGAAAIRMAAGHAIAFEPTNSYRLAYDSTTNTLRWNQGNLSYAVGKGISVGWQTTYASSTTLPNYVSGNIVFLVGNSSPYTITLPAANTVAAGTGYTFSVLGSANVTIATTGGNTIDNGPMTLRQNDRYHIVSDGVSAWREVFRTNAVSPRFSGPPVLPSYTVSTLPGSPGAGAKAFASNGRKPNEGTGVGTGVEVFYDGGRWISVCSGSQVAA